MDRMANLGTGRASPTDTTNVPAGICVQGTEPPLPSKKWKSCVWAYGMFLGVQYAMWLPMWVSSTDCGYNGPRVI